MTKIQVGSYVASMKAAPAEVRDRNLFLQRVRLRDEVPVVADLELVGLGGSCGKPAFLLPRVLRWNEENTLKLEQIAQDFDCFVEYGAYPHLKLLESGMEVAAVQDWSMATLIFVRPGYEQGLELLSRLRDDLRD